MKARIWSTDWFTGLAYAGVFAVLALVLARDFVYGIETGAYDRAMQMTEKRPSREVAVIAIDERSIDNIGRWPWSRDILASAIDQLASGGARVIASTIFVSEPQIDPGLDAMRELQRVYQGGALAAAAGDPNNPLAADLVDLSKRFTSSIAALEYDARLVESTRGAGNVVLPMALEIGQPLGRPDGPLPDYIAANTVSAEDVMIKAIPARRILPPISELGRAADALGHLTVLLDDDGAARFEPLLVRYYDHFLPSLALTVAARHLNLTPGEIEVIPDEGVRLGALEIRTTPELRMYNHFYAGAGDTSVFSVDSFYDVFTGQVPVDKFRDRTVLIGASAAGLGDNFKTPVAAAEPPVIILAHTISSLLQEHFYTRPAWAKAAELAILAGLALYLMFLMPQLSARMAASATIGLVVALLASEFLLLAQHSQWLQLVTPVLFLVGGHMLLTIKRFGVTERLKLSSDAEGAESNKMLGLAFQGQGQLDMAFEKFRRCPLEEGLLEVLYNLALDYERKRQFSKAASVYGYMSGCDARYRDIRERLQRSQQMEETLVLGAASVSPGGTLIIDAEGVEKPMLGRYVIEREIGKGAMGVVYQGRDPKINRVVAIKTVSLASEFEDEALTQARDRFFREAESAGRLSHPNIVTVYDAGEEHDLAYIAMEFLHGDHLNKHVRADSLLPPATVLSLIARASEALDFAHHQGIIHRDIKPANLMWNPDKDALKITDFGIARITDSSQTKTGIVLGTPSYMSPEQLAGKNVTGGSDIFSLGVTLYQLLTGQLPFRADSMATLMFKIANEPHTPLAAVRPDLPERLCDIIDQALAKDPADRFDSGMALAVALRACIDTLSGAEAAKQTA